MPGFDYFRTAHGAYEPKTARAAMRGYEAGLLPLEAYVYRAASARAVTDEPYDLEELERVLARPDLDLETNVALARVLVKLTRADDAEAALFAAESLNQIESRYLSRIEALKRDGAAEAPAEAAEAPAEGGPRKLSRERLRELAQAYYELSQLYEGAGSIRRFYLREAYAALSRMARGGRGDLVLLVRILIQLGLSDQAARLLAPHMAGRDPFFLLLEAEVEFSRHNFARVFELATWLVQNEEALAPAQRELVAYWLGR